MCIVVPWESDIIIITLMMRVAVLTKRTTHMAMTIIIITPTV